MRVSNAKLISEDNAKTKRQILETGDKLLDDKTMKRPERSKTAHEDRFSSWKEISLEDYLTG